MSDNSPEDCGYTKPEPDKRPENRYLVRLPVKSNPCKWCTSRIVWSKMPSGANMPLSFSSRQPVMENGQQVGFSMIPHFADCPNWPKRKKK